MEQFVLDQKWMTSDPIFGTFFGTVIEVSDGGKSGTVIITADTGDIVDTFSGSAEVFQASGEWRLVAEDDK